MPTRVYPLPRILLICTCLIGLGGCDSVDALVADLKTQFADGEGETGSEGAEAESEQETADGLAQPGVEEIRAEADEANDDKAQVAAKQPEADGSVAARHFIEVKGDVTIDGQPAAAKMEIGLTSIIKTGANGRALFTLLPGSVVEIRKKSELVFGTSESRVQSLELLQGSLWSFLPEGMNDYEVRTANAVAVPTGPTFYIEAINGKKTYVCACDGKLEILRRQGKTKKPLKKIKSANQHKAFMILSRGKKGKTKAKKHKRMNHSEKQRVAITRSGKQGE